jgi:hypothetical protein
MPDYSTKKKAGAFAPANQLSLKLEGEVHSELTCH